MDQGQLPALTAEERAVYEWQLWTPGFGEEAQRRIKGASALVSRCGGLGGPVALQLAAAGVGRLVLAHGGNLKPSDLNRQVLMTHDWLGRPRVECAARRLKELNPRLVIEAVPENITEANAARLVGSVDLVFSCAPLFTERLLMNREAVRQGRPMIDGAMYSLEGQVLTILPRRSACLACLYPELPPGWKRQFPVFGAVPQLAASVAVMEGLKLITGQAPSLADCLLYFDMRSMSFHKLSVARRADCAVCGKA